MEITYSKKQLNPIITKYNIDVESDLFMAILLLFNNQPNYQLWAVKMIYSKGITMSQLEAIKEWADANQTEIASLSKGNIILYKNENDIKTLFKEMIAIEKISLVKNVANKFNTDQKNAIKEALRLTEGTPLQVVGRTAFKEWFEILSNFNKLPLARQEKSINLASAIHNDINMLQDHIKGCLAKKYKWNKEDMLAYMAINCPKCSIIYDDDNIVIIDIHTFEDSKKMCGNGRTQWCLTREERYFNNYVNSEKAQYFLFNFNLTEDDDFSHIGFTVDPLNGIVNAHSTRNNNLIGKVTYRDESEYFKKEESYSVHDIFNKLKIPNSVYMRLKRLMCYEWTKESLAKFVAQNQDKLQIVSENGNKIVVKATGDISANLTKHTFIRANSSNVAQWYVYFDFGVDYNNDNALFVASYKKDKWGTISFYEGKNSFNGSIDKQYMKNHGFDVEAIVEQTPIEPCVLLHKYIEEGNETAAIDIIKKYGDDFNINYEFNHITPVFSAIDAKMVDLYKTIISHKAFNSNTLNIMQTTTFELLLLSYMFIDNSARDNSKIKDMIEMTLGIENYDFNHINITNDTALGIACERPHCNWVVERLIQNPNVNVNIVNDINCTALGQAIRCHNIDAIKILLTRKDLVIRDYDYTLAENNNVNLKELVKTVRGTNFTVEEATVTNYTNNTEEVFKKLFESLAHKKTASK